MDLGLDGRTVIITGASAGIGRASAELFADEGANLVLCARGIDRLEPLAASLRGRGVEVTPVSADVTDPASSDAIRDAALEATGRIDAVVHAAGGADNLHIKKFDESVWLESYRLNTLGAIRLSHACIPTMREQQWGRIVTVASTAGRDPDPRFAAYGAAKAALMHATRALSRAYAKDGVLSNCVLPGLTRSESVLKGYESAADHMGVSPEEVERRMMELQPIAMGRTGEPEEVAAAVVFLCSEAANWITGAQLPVDGGTMRDLP